MTASGPLVLVVAISLAALATGRLFVSAFGGSLYRRCDPAGVAASLSAGTAVLALLSVGLSGLGFATRDLPPLVAALLLVSLAIGARRRRLDVWRPRGAAQQWASLLLPIALTAVLGLLPVTRAGGFSFGNDTYTYSAFSEWLQGHGYSEHCRWEAQSPVTGIPALYQSQGYDLGIAHLLALVQAAVRPATVLVVYPQVSSFGLVLLAATTWLAARQLLRFGSLGAGAVALGFALVPHALYWGHHNGFLQQGYALPMVLFGLVLLARASPSSCWRPATAALLALPFAFLVSVYLPLVPLLGFATAVAFAPLLLRARRRGHTRRLVTFAAAVASCVLLYAARDVVGALSPLLRFATSQAGGHIPWGPADFFQFALGTRVLAPGWVNVELPVVSTVNRALTPLYGLLFLAGIGYAARVPRTRHLAGAALLLVLAAVYFALAVNDPWSGRLGHTWNLFKLTQWAWPFALLLAALAAKRLATASAVWRPAVLALALVVPASQIGVHWPWSDRFGEAMREMLPGTTFDDLPALRQRVQALPAGTLLVVGRPVNTHRWLSTAVSLVAYPRAIVGDWTDSASNSNHPMGGDALYADLMARWDEPRVVPIAVGLAPFSTRGVEPLGAGFALILKQRDPFVVHVVNPTGVDPGSAASGASFRIGIGRTKVVIFAPDGGRVALELGLRAYAGRPGNRLVAFLAGGDYSHRSVRLASDGSPAAVVALGGATSLRIPLELAPGLNTVVLVVDEGRGSLDAREPVTVTGLSLVALEPGR